VTQLCCRARTDDHYGSRCNSRSRRVSWRGHLTGACCRSILSF